MGRRRAWSENRKVCMYFTDVMLHIVFQRGRRDSAGAVHVISLTSRLSALNDFSRLCPFLFHE